MSMTPDQLADRLAMLADGGTRRIAALVGAPGSGKTTLAEAAVRALFARNIPAAVLSMDGFHYDDAVLHARNLHPRKGAPDTFDVAGFGHLLARLRRNEEPEIAVPVFDRDLEISRNAARIIPQQIGLLLVEGNYLLLDQPGWRDLATYFDLSVMLDVPEAELRRRLYQRWRDQGIAEDLIAVRVEGNDMSNGRLVRSASRRADITIPTAASA